MVIILMPVIGFAQSASSPDWEKIHVMTTEGIDALYDFKFKEAEAKFDNVIQEMPQDPRGYFFKAMIYHYRYHMLEVNADYEKFISLSDTVIDVAEEVLDRDENNSNAMFYLGGIYGYRGLILQDKENILKAVWDGKKGYGYLEDAIEINPQNYDAYLGLGLYNYLASRIPKFWHWIISLIGFDPDGLKGKQQLTLVATKGVYTRYEAKWWLSQIYNWERQPEKAFKYLSELATSFPDNPFYTQNYGEVLVNQQHRADEAIPWLEKAINTNNPDAERFATLGYYRLGHAYRFKNEFPKAIELYKKFISTTTIDTLRKRYAHFLTGLCYEMLGDRASAIPYYEIASNYPDAQALLKEPMSDFQKSLETMNNHFAAGYFDLGSKTSSELLSRQNITDDQRSDILFSVGGFYYDRKDYAGAESTYTKVLSLNIQKDKSRLPNTHFELGRIYLKMEKKDLAKREFKTVLEYKDYEGEKYLRDRAEEEIDKLDD